MTRAQIEGRIMQLAERRAADERRRLETHLLLDGYSVDEVDEALAFTDQHNREAMSAFRASLQPELDAEL